MKISKVVTISKELLPKREEYLNSTQLIAECAKQNVGMSRKTLHNYIQDKLLPQGAHVGQEVLFHKEFFLSEIAAIHILKSVFHVNYKELKVITKNKFANFQDIVQHLNSILAILEDKHIGKGKKQPLLIKLSNEPFLQSSVELFLKRIKDGIDPENMDMQKFINECFDKE